jgi:cytochrome P450 family 9
MLKIVYHKSVDDLLAQSLLSLKGDEWRKMRHSLTPAFTGSKLRGMTELMVQIGLQYSRFMVSRASPDESIDMKNIFRRQVVQYTFMGQN